MAKKIDLEQDYKNFEKLKKVFLGNLFFSSSKSRIVSKIEEPKPKAFPSNEQNKKITVPYSKKELDKGILDYIKTELKKGFYKEYISEALVKNGYDSEYIQRHFNHITNINIIKYSTIYTIVVVLITAIINNFFL